MRTLILITFVAFASSTKCLSDIASATVSIGKATSNIADAIYECPNKSKKAGCASDISLAVTNLGEASQAIDAAVTDCSGGKKNSTCAKDLTSIATALGKTGTDVTNAVQDCQKFDLKCTLDITGASIELVTITKNIIHATSDCKSMFVESSQQSLSSSTLVARSSIPPSLFLSPFLLLRLPAGPVHLRLSLASELPLLRDDALVHVLPSLAVPEINRVSLDVANANHGRAEASRALHENLGVIEVRDSPHNRRGALHGVVGLEDATPDKHAVHAKLHHEGSVGGRGAQLGRRRRRSASAGRTSGRARPRPAASSSAAR